MAGSKVVQWTAIVYAALATLAAVVGWFLDGAAFHWTLGLLPGPWAEELAAETTAPRIFLVAVLWAIALQLSLGTALLVARLRKRRAWNPSRILGGIVALIGAAVAAIEIVNLVTGDDGSGFVVVAAAMVVSGIWCAILPFSRSPPVAPSYSTHSTIPGTRQGSQAPPPRTPARRGPP